MVAPTVRPSALIPNLEERLATHTLPFLSALLACSVEDAIERTVTVQVFDDKADRRDPSMAKTFHGSLRNLASELDRRNHQGAGVFVTANETDGSGRSKSHICRKRAWWADLDSKTALVPFDSSTIPLPPSLLVASGHGNHVYWCAQDPFLRYCNRHDQEAHEYELKCIQKSLSEMGADPTVCEVARVMRLPGYRNMKCEPFPLVVLTGITPIRYTQDEIQTGFNVADQPLQPPESPSWPSPIVEDSARGHANRIAAYTRALAAAAPAIAGQQGHATTLRAAIKIACGFNLSEQDATRYLLEFFNPFCCPPWSEAELNRKVREAHRVCPNRGWLLP